MRTLVLLHGAASNSTRWWRYVRDTRLAGWDIVCPDLRGHAWRSGPADRRRAGVREWCEDVARLLDARDCPRAVIGGHCLGANIALHFASRRPERVAGLVLVEPMPRAAFTGTARRLAPFRAVAAGVAAVVQAMNALGVRRRRLQPMDLEEWDEALARGEGDLSRYASPLSDLRCTPLAAYLRNLAAVGEPLPDLGKIAAPALVLLSANAAWVDPARSREEMARLPRSDIVTIPARHWIPTEQPEAMREAIDGWLARNYGATDASS